MITYLDTNACYPLPILIQRYKIC